MFFPVNLRQRKGDPDFPRMVSPREQLHTDLTEAGVKSAVLEIVQQLKDQIQLSTKDGRLRPAKTKGGPLNAWGTGFPGACVKLEDSPVRARRCKGPGARTSALKALARVQHRATGRWFLLPEVM